MKTFCECKCSKTRHRARHGEAGAGACFDCHCSQMTAARYELFVGERRILAKIAETTEIGRYVLGDDLAEANDPARDALGAILYNLHSAAFVASNFKGDGHTLSATPAGREYLSGGQRG